MNYKTLLFAFLLFVSSCKYQPNFKNDEVILQGKKFSNRGFSLIYSHDLFEKKIIKNKIENRSLILFQKDLKKDSNVKITNLNNSKYIIAKVGSNVEYPTFYNSVISKRIADELNIDESEPYIEIKLINNSNTFLAKKAKTFDEEKKVADKAPVDSISINNLNKKSKIDKVVKKHKFNYIIKIADFYYENTAILMQNKIIDELKLKNSKISKISNTNYRVYFGPFDNLKSLKNVFDDITPLNFENIEIIKL